MSVILLLRLNEMREPLFGPEKALSAWNVI